MRAKLCLALLAAAATAAPAWAADWTKVVEALGKPGADMQPTGGGRMAITGDFVLIAAEVNPVLRELRAHGIEVTAIHNHMLDDEPRLVFMHFWANDDAATLAAGLRAALDKIKLARS